MQANDTANITCKILSANCSWQICIRAFSIKLDDIVSIIQISCWIFVRKFPTEELWQTLHFNFMDAVNVKPSTAAWYDKCSFWVFLLEKMLLIFICLSLSFFIEFTSFRNFLSLFHIFITNLFILTLRTSSVTVSPRCGWQNHLPLLKCTSFYLFQIILLRLLISSRSDRAASGSYLPRATGNLLSSTSQLLPRSKVD